MKAIFYAAIAIVVVSIGSYLVLGQIGFSSADRGAGQAVRLGDDS